MPGSGRKKGTPNKTTPADRQRAKARKVLAKHITLLDLGTDPETAPLEFFLAIMRRGDLPLNVRMDAGRCAAPYCHRALKAVDMNIDGTVTVEIVD